MGYGKKLKDPKQKDSYKKGLRMDIVPDQELRSIKVGDEALPVYVSATDVFLQGDTTIGKDLVASGAITSGGSVTSSAGICRAVGSLQDLSDVTYSSGDLTITAWDTINMNSNPLKILSGALGGLALDINNTGATAHNQDCFSIDFDYTGVMGSLELGNFRGINLDMNCDAPSIHALGTINMWGLDIDLVADTDGVETARGIDLNVSGGDTNIGMTITVPDGASDYHLRLIPADNVSEYGEISVANTGDMTIKTLGDGTTDSDLTLDVDGDINMDADGGDINITSCDVNIAATKGLYLDGGGDTYIYEQGADALRIVVGGDNIMHMTESGDDGNAILMDSCAGFVQKEPTYDATTTVVDFRHSNKQFVTFGAGSITNANLFFPLVSGNFILLVKQDGTGSRTISNYKVYEFDESAADGHNSIKWAGGTQPTLTTDANHVDILSFYWDADNEIAYGTATLDFQF